MEQKTPHEAMKISTLETVVAAPPEAATPSAPQEIVDVLTTRIVKSKELQPRNGLNDATVKRYAQQMEAGHIFPPVTICRVGDVLYLADGWHRLAAAEMNNAGFIKAIVIESTIEDARWAAGEANLRHGLPLKRSEIRNVFRLFIKARKHLKGKKRMSYAEIGAVLGKPKTTIRNWMIKDFPRIAAGMSSDEEGMNTKWSPEPPETSKEILKRQIREATEQLLPMLQGLYADDREEMIAHVREMLTDAEVESPFEPPKVEEAEF